MLRQAVLQSGLGLTAVLFGVVVAVIGAAQLANTAHPGNNTFDTLAVLMPGQPMSGMSAEFAYICDSTMPASSRNLLCRVNAHHTRFTQLSIFVKDGIIDRLTIEGSQVSVGDMALLWGFDYRIQRLGRVRFIRWDHDQYATVPADVPFRYSLPTRTVSFNRILLP